MHGRFHFFGSTAHGSPRLEKFASGTDVVLSTAVANDPEVRAYLQTRPAHLEPFHQHLKGFDDEEFTLFRLTV
mgnify:CR=1 FL=1